MDMFACCIRSPHHNLDQTSPGVVMCVCARAYCVTCVCVCAKRYQGATSEFPKLKSKEERVGREMDPSLSACCIFSGFSIRRTVEEYASALVRCGYKSCANNAKETLTVGFARSGTESKGGKVPVYVPVKCNVLWRSRPKPLCLWRRARHCPQRLHQGGGCS